MEDWKYVMTQFNIRNDPFMFGIKENLLLSFMG